MKTDWVAEHFLAMKDCGEDISIIYGHLSNDTGESRPLWYELPHNDFDGISGLAWLFRQKLFKVPSLPELKDDRYRFTRSVRGLMSAIPAMNTRRQEWTSFNRHNPKQNLLPDQRIAWTLFSEEESKYIFQASKRYGVTVNSYLLFHLDAATSRVLVKPEASRRWMVPVNMRGAVSRPNEYSPQMAFWSVDCEHGVSMKELHEQIIRLKTKGFHWGSWALFNAGFLLGKAGMRKDIQKRDKTNHCWTGTFSNLGDWKVSQAGNWLFGPTTSRTYPVAAGCVTVNSRLALTIQLHEALNANFDKASELMEQWRQECLSDSKEIPNL